MPLILTTKQLDQAQLHWFFQRHHHRPILIRPCESQGIALIQDRLGSTQHASYISWQPRVLTQKNWIGIFNFTLNYKLGTLFFFFSFFSLFGAPSLYVFYFSSPGRLIYLSFENFIMFCWIKRIQESPVGDVLKIDNIKN